MMETNPQNLTPGKQLIIAVDLKAFAGELERLGYKAKVPITIRIADIEGVTFSKKVTYVMDQWGLSEKRAISSGEPRISWTDLQFPQRTGLQAQLEADGYEIRWTAESSLSERLSAGWERVIYMSEGFPYYLNIKDRPYNLLLLKKKK
jgi:hypothetical protein